MSKLILLAEDDPFISRMYQIKLESGGYTVIAKNNGRDAFEAIRSEHPSLVMLDINMPEMTGLEVLSALRRDGFDFEATPILVLTNSSKQEDQAAAKEYGAEYLVKADLTPREVLDLIASKVPATEV